MAEERALTLRKFDCEEDPAEGGFGDWYLIEWAKHEGISELRRTNYGMALFCSSRPSDADIEGTADEMLCIAAAIEARGRFSARRCSVAVGGDDVYMGSPKNSTKPAKVGIAVADALAKEIRAKLGAA